MTSPGGRSLCALALAGALALPFVTAAAQTRLPVDGVHRNTSAEKRAGQPDGRGPSQPGPEWLDLSVYSRIRAEATTHSQVMTFAAALLDGIGPRLTGSPNMQRAHEWTRDTLSRMGLENARLEDWGEFGMGWYQINSWGRIVTPEPEPIWLQAAPWSVASKGAVRGEIVYLPLVDASQLDSLKGTLKDKIVLLGAMRPVPDIDQPLSFRYSDEELKELEGPGVPRRLTGPPPTTPEAQAERDRLNALRQRAVKMMEAEGVAAILVPSPSNVRTAGTGIVSTENTTSLLRPAWRRENLVSIPHAVVMIEHYNRLARLAQAKVPVTVDVHLETAFTGDHEHGFNTVAEIPGSDPQLKDQVVMIGGHLDSWTAGTGATDNGAGVIIAMEAVRILKALGLKPRRTIRIALWGGEEQGIFGSKGYVDQHFGKPVASGPPNRKAEWTTLDAYYNVDAGGGKIPGIYAQGNYAAAAIFSQWIAPLKDLGVTTVTTRNAVGSDHLSFDDVGLPGFQFIQDELDYETRTHHSNLDTVDHLRPADLQQAATVAAIFLWNSSERDAMMPRK